MPPALCRTAMPLSIRIDETIFSSRFYESLLFPLA
nr:MAG TPA: hypothetical protein [Caudoviricetes sp.]